MPMIDCQMCNGRGYDHLGHWRIPCSACNGTGRVPDDFFPEDSSELRDPDEEDTDDEQPGPSQEGS